MVWSAINGHLGRPNVVAQLVPQCQTSTNGAKAAIAAAAVSECCYLVLPVSVRWQLPEWRQAVTCCFETYGFGAFLSACQIAPCYVLEAAVCAQVEDCQDRLAAANHSQTKLAANADVYCAVARSKRPSHISRSFTWKLKPNPVLADWHSLFPGKSA